MNNATSQTSAKVLMLWPDASEDIPSIIAENYADLVCIDSLYRPANTITRVIRKVLSILNLSTLHFCEKWIEQIALFDMIIIHANPINRSIPKMLRKRGYKGRIIYWWWNPVHMSISPNKINRQDCELWSFSEDDCREWNLQHNSTYYFLHHKTHSSYSNKKILFCGQDKGRYAQLQHLKQKLSTIGYESDFLIIKDSTSPKEGDFSPYIPYRQMVSRICEDYAIVEILQEGQTGMSLRVMESLFFGKKLISNNHTLEQEPFYSKKNIFILGKDNISELKLFLETPMEKTSPDLKEHFDFSTWLQRFNITNNKV